MFCNQPIGHRMDGHIFEKRCNGNKPKFPVVRLPSSFKKIKKVEGRGWHGEPCDLKQTVDAMTEGWNRGVE